MVFACAFEKGRLPFAYVYSRDAEGQQVFQHKLEFLAGNREGGVRVSTNFFVKSRRALALSAALQPFPKERLARLQRDR